MVQGVQELKGALTVGSQRFALVVARFNSVVTDGLLEGAIGALKQHGASEEQLTVVRVPGAFELPLVVRRLVDTKKYDGVIALGAVIRGDTPHFEYVSSACTQGLSQVMMDSGVPVSFGVLTTDNLEQAMVRSGGKGENKGADVALCLIEMVNLLEML